MLSSLIIITALISLLTVIKAQVKQKIDIKRHDIKIINHNIAEGTKESQPCVHDLQEKKEEI